MKEKRNSYTKIIIFLLNFIEGILSRETFYVGKLSLTHNAPQPFNVKLLLRTFLTFFKEILANPHIFVGVMINCC